MNEIQISQAALKDLEKQFKRKFINKNKQINHMTRQKYYQNEF